MRHCEFCQKPITKRRNRFCDSACWNANKPAADPDYQIKWQRRNSEKCRAYNRKHYKKNASNIIARTVAYRKKRYRTNPVVNITARLRSRLYETLKLGGAKKAANFRSLLGCTASELRRHIESTFAPGMTWKNRRLWHVDHIKPCAAFNLIDPEQQRECFHYRNLCARWAGDNMRKGSKYTPLNGKIDT